MSYLVVGISHRSAAIDVLERVALDAEAATKLGLAVRNSAAVAESAVVATCNRTEVYATVDRFHAGMDEVTAILSDITGVPLLDLAEHLYVHFEEGAGLVPVEILMEQGRVVGAELTAPQPLKRLSQLSPEQAAGCISLAAADIRTDRHAPQIVSVGMPFLVAELHSREALRSAKPDAAAFARILPCDGAFAIYFYTSDVPPSEGPCELQARMFFPGASGLTEDPATGSATVAAAAFLADLDPAPDGELRLTIGQGFDMGRPSLLSTRVVKQGCKIVSAHVGGRCAPMMQGTFWLEGEE